MHMARDSQADWHIGAGQVKRSYSLAIDVETGSSAYVPEFPAIHLTVDRLTN